MKDELYIDDNKVDLGSNEIVLNKSFGKPADMSVVLSGYSYTINLPKTAHNMQILGFCNQVNVISDYPHKEHTAKVIRGGVSLFDDGVATIKGASDSIEVLIKWGVNKRFGIFTNDKLRQTFSLFGSIRWDYGLSQNNYVKWFADTAATSPAYPDQLRPAVKASFLWEAIVGQKYTINSNYKSLIDKLWIMLPTTNGDENSVNNLTFRLKGTVTSAQIGTRRFPDILPFITYTNSLTTSELYDLYYEVKSISLPQYIKFPIGGKYRIHGTIKPKNGSPEWRFRIYAKPEDDADPESIKYDYDVNKTTFDDVVEFSDKDYCFAIYNPSIADTYDIDLTFSRVIKDSSDYSKIGFLMNYPIMPNLPDITMMDFLKSIMGIFGLFVNQKPDELEFFNVNDVINNKANAIDITNMLIDKKSDKLEYSYGLTQHNYLKYSEDELVTKGFGDSEFSANTYDKSDNVIYQSPYVATDVRVPLYSYDDNKFVLNKTTKCRIFIESGNKIVQVWDKWKTFDNLDKTFVSFVFDPLKYDILARKYWQGHIGIFGKQPRISYRKAILPTEFVKNLSSKTPVYAEGNYYMLLSVKNYNSNGLADLELALIDGVSIEESELTDALIETYESPIKFDINDIALYQRSGLESSDGKLIRELSDPVVGSSIEHAYIPIDLGSGPAVKYPLSKIGGGGLWTKVNKDSEEYISTDYYAYTQKSFVAKMDVIAYGADDSFQDYEIPLASYTQKGILSVKQGSALRIVDGVLDIDPDLIGGGGLDEEQLKAYLTNNKYITQSSPLTGYAIASAYTAITPSDTVLTALGKLERNFSNYVDLTTDQLIKGKKTFQDTIIGNQDIICYAADSSISDLQIPFASTTQAGLIRVGKNLSIDPETGILDAEAGGISFTAGTALQLTSANVLNVMLGTTGTTACAGNDSRLSNSRPASDVYAWAKASEKPYYSWSEIGSKPSWIGSSKPSYTFSEVGALSSSDSRISGWNTAASNAHWHTNKTYLDYIDQDLSTTGSPFFRYGLSTGNKSDVWIQISSGNSVSGMYQSNVANLYLNYVSSSKNVRIDGDCNIMSSGDIIAYAVSSSISDIVATATSSTYGIVKYDNSTIKMNSSGQLYAVSSGGGSSVSVIDNLTSTSTTSALSANQGRLLDGRLQSVKFGTNYTGYVVTQLGSTSYNLSKSDHTHSWDSLTSKPSWIGASKPSYSWSEITSKPTILSSISYSTSGSGNAVTDVTASGSTVYVTKGTISGGSWGGGTINNNITISNSNPGIGLSGSNPFVNFGSSWSLTVYSGDMRIMYGGSSWAYSSYNGNFWVKGSLVQGSDMRRKTVVSYLDSALQGINSLSVFRYTYNNDTTKRIRIGLSAQQVNVCFPEFVYTESDGYYSLDYASMVSIVIMGMKELYRKHLSLENSIKSIAHWRLTKDEQIKFLMKENDLLKARVAEIEGRAA